MYGLANVFTLSYITISFNFFFFEIVSHYIAQAVLEFSILQPVPPKRDYWHVPLLSAFAFLFLLYSTKASCLLGKHSTPSYILSLANVSLS